MATPGPILPLAPANGATARPRLLLVEDEAIVAMDMADQLSQLGYHVVAAADNGPEALRLAAEHQPDLVLMDVHIKGDMDGVDTAAALMGQQHTPVLYLTAFTDTATVHRAAATAPYGYVAKPFHMKELRAAIDVALYKSGLEKRLKASELWFASTLRCVADAVVAVDNDGRVRFMNAAAETTLGTALDQALNQPVSQWLRFADAAPTEPAGPPDAATPRLVFGRTLVTPDGRQVPVDESTAPIRDEHDQVLGTVHALPDVTPRLQAESALRQSEERFRTAFDFAPVGMALVAMDGRFLQGNAALHRMLKCNESALLRLNLSDVSLPEDTDLQDEQLRDLVTGRSPFLQFERRYRATDGSAFWALVSVSVLHNGDTPVCLLVQMHEMTARKQAEQVLLRQAQTDALTGLFNRLRLTEELHRWVARARRQREPFAVVFMDLDHFKAVNDGLGHAAGDEVLMTVARRLQGALRESDGLGRWGGDEFVALIAGVSSPDDLSTVGRKLQALVGTPISVGEGPTAHNVQVGLSLGVSLCPADGTDADALLRQADQALYRAKTEGRGRLRFFGQPADAPVEQRSALAMALQIALGEDGLTLQVQPPLHPTHRAPAMPAFHLAVATWTDPHGQTWPEDALTELAQASGLGHALDQWRLTRACQWAAQAGQPVVVAVSAAYLLGQRAVRDVQRTLQATGLPPQHLSLSLPMALHGHLSLPTEQALGELQALGVSVGLGHAGDHGVDPKGLRAVAPQHIALSPRVLPTPTDAVAARGSPLAVWLALGQALGVDVWATDVDDPARAQALLAAGCAAVYGIRGHAPHTRTTRQPHGHDTA